MAIVAYETDLSINHLHGINGVTQKIKKAMYESAKQFVYIGFLLKEVRDYKYYEEGGYNSVYDYAEFELGFKKSSTKNFIAITENFGIQKYEYNGIRRENQTMSLQQEYEKFNYSQLVELLAMSDTQRTKAKPNMTVKQLREIKRQPEETNQIDFKTLDTIISTGQTSGQEDHWIKFRGKAPQTGKYNCKLVLHIVYLDGKPRSRMDFAFYRDEKWTDRKGKELFEVTHYREIPEIPADAKALI